MSHEPSRTGPLDGPFSQPPPPPHFVSKPPCTLDALLSHEMHTGTRFGFYAARNAPTDPAKVATLLETCGYDVRRAASGSLELRGDSGRWRPAPVPVAVDPMLYFLQRVADIEVPARSTDPNDQRFDIVFGRQAST